MKPAIAITMGDPAGVGPELCAKVLTDPRILGICTPVIYGSYSVWRRLEQAGLACQLQCIELERWRSTSGISEPVLVDVVGGEELVFEPGRVNSECGRAAFEFIRVAIEDAMVGRVAAVVTAPINKKALNLAGVPYPGHTEIFTSLTGAKRTCMMQWSEALTVTMVTTHVGYADVPKRLSVERIFDVICLSGEAMRWMLGREPRIGVCALNPHAGENGLFGYGEEERVILPAVVKAKESGLNVEGPLVPDAAFTPHIRSRYDCIVTMYHDQGHIPFKMVAFDVGVNITLGLPIIRTSVDHGTAFDIAWKGIAKPTSLFNAINVAVRMHHGRAPSQIR